MAVDRLPTEVLGVQRACTKCGLSKDLGEFYKHPDYADGRHSWCKGCFKEARIAHRTAHPELAKNTKYGVDFNLMWAKQQGLCALCGTLMLPKGQGALSVVVDHDHSCCPDQKSCGLCVRGLLHSRCNQLLGMSFEDTNILHAAVEYLDRWRGSHGH